MIDVGLRKSELAFFFRLKTDKSGMGALSVSVCTNTDLETGFCVPTEKLKKDVLEFTSQCSMILLSGMCQGRGPNCVNNMLMPQLSVRV